MVPFILICYGWFWRTFSFHEATRQLQKSTKRHDSFENADWINFFCLFILPRCKVFQHSMSQSNLWITIASWKNIRQNIIISCCRNNRLASFFVLPKNCSICISERKHGTRNKKAWGWQRHKTCFIDWKILKRQLLSISSELCKRGFSRTEEVKLLGVGFSLPLNSRLTQPFFWPTNK